MAQEKLKANKQNKARQRNVCGGVNGLFLLLFLLFVRSVFRDRASAPGSYPTDLVAHCGKIRKRKFRQPAKVKCRLVVTITCAKLHKFRAPNARTSAHSAAHSHSESHSHLFVERPSLPVGKFAKI